MIFILADDLGWGDLRCYGDEHLGTPVLDSLAKAGARLTAHYALSSWCAPSRAAYLTGRYNHRTGAVGVPSNRGLDRIDLLEKTFGDFLRHAGYTTAHIDEWHDGSIAATICRINGASTYFRALPPECRITGKPTLALRPPHSLRNARTFSTMI